MSQSEVERPSVHERFEEILELLRKHEHATAPAESERGTRDRLVGALIHTLHLAELQKVLDELHPADIAYVLEALPLDQRLIVWELVKTARDGEILLEVSDAVRETLIADMDKDELVAAAGQLDADEIADLAPDLPREVIRMSSSRFRPRSGISCGRRCPTPRTRSAH
jgi:magnesium transporter